MKITGRRVDFMTDDEIRRIVDYALRIVEEIGLQIENETMCKRLAECGCAWDGETRVRFPRKLMDEYIERERGGRWTPPAGELPYSGGISGYPLRTVDPHDLKVKLHTARTVADMNRLCDWLPHIHGIGMVGVPSDIPPLLQPFWMRFLDWRYCGQTLSNGYVIWDERLCPFIAEFCETVSEMEPEQGGMARFFRAHNYLVSPLRYPAAEARQFVWFWERGYRCDIGNLVSIGGASPVTIAGSVGLCLAEMLGLSYLHHVFYGDKGLHFYSKPAPLDMRTGYMPYGRPEESLAGLAMSNIVDWLCTGEAGGPGHCTAAKQVDVELGLNKALTAGLDMVLLGKLNWSFGLFSTDEINDPRLVVIENEYVDGLLRLARGFEVNDDTLPFDAVREVGPGGNFLGHPHTAAHFRKELWMPSLMSGMSYEQWSTTDGISILDKARKQVLEILDTYHPRGMREETEGKLLSLIDGYARKLGITDYRRPDLPE